MAYHLNPNPNNEELLWMGVKHRAHQVYMGNVPSSRTLNVKRGDQKLFVHIKKCPIRPDVKEIIISEGFGGVLEVGCIRVDHSLITALVEKWHPETHTFHFLCGEATVTLQDVQVLWGLPVDGRVVTGTDGILERTDSLAYITSLLGFTPNLQNSYIRMKELREEMEKPVREVRQRARVYILHLIGGVLCPDTSGNKVHICWLSNLEHVGTNIKYSWGSAVLAQLYRNLCKAATFGDQRDIAGPMTLLQMWAWERIYPIQPKMKRNETSVHGKVLGVRWNDERKFEDIARFSISSYRQTLSLLRDPLFNWTPYDDKLVILSETCRSGVGSWRSDTFLVCWEFVEPHLPSRVLRQFSLVQQTPRNVGLSREDHVKLHKDSKAGNLRDKNWERKHDKYIQLFYNRQEHVADSQPINNERTTQEYMSWFVNHTTPYVAPPSRPSNNFGFPNIATNMHVMYEGLSRLQQIPGETGDIATRYINESHASEWFPHMAPHVVEGYQVPQPDVHRENRMSRRRNEAGPSNANQQPRRRNARRNEAGPSNAQEFPNRFDLNDDGGWQTQ